MSKTRRWLFTCLVLVLSVFAAACGDDSESDTGGSPSSDTGGSGGSEETGAEPVRGGTLVFGTFSEPRGLDPIVATGYGVTGGIELSAIYDTLVAYDPETKQYVMRTAESLTPNDDFTEWTLKIKSGITFTDGTPYDAEAVKFNIERHQSAQNQTTSRAMVSTIAGTEVVDPLTLRITLSEPWAGFPFVLSDRVGMIVSPTAVQKLGDQLATNPVGAGAGPFELVSFNPKEAIVLKRNESYWGGDVYLDEVRFVNIVGGAASYEALKADTVQVVFLRDPKAVTQAKDDGYDGFENVQQASTILLMNNGVEVTCQGGQPAACAGQPDGTRIATQAPTTSKLVRQAIAAAIDPKVIDERENAGYGEPDTALVQSTFPWDPGVPGPQFDLDKAKDLVAKAKAEGWDGKVRLKCDNSPASQARALAVDTLLAAAGIELEVANTEDVSGTIGAVISRKDFDIACWGLSVPGDDGGIFQLDYFFSSTSASNRTGYKNPAMDAALKELKAAANDDARRAAMEKIAELYAEDVPVLSLQAVREYIAWDDSVHGIVPNQGTQVFLDKAWIG